MQWEDLADAMSRPALIAWGENQDSPLWMVQVERVLSTFRNARELAKVRDQVSMRITNCLDPQDTMPLGHHSLARNLGRSPDYGSIFEMGHNPSIDSTTINFGRAALYTIAMSMPKTTHLTIDLQSLDLSTHPRGGGLEWQRARIDGPTIPAVVSLASSAGFQHNALDVTIKCRWAPCDPVRHYCLTKHGSLQQQNYAFGALSALRKAQCLRIDFGSASRSHRDCTDFLQYATLSSLRHLAISITCAIAPHHATGFAIRHMPLLQDFTLSSATSCRIVVRNGVVLPPAT